MAPPPDLDQQQKRQTLRRHGTLESGTRVGHPSLVSKQRFLRSRRSGPSQVRDVASGPCRQQLHQRLRAGLRLFSSLVLSSSECLPAGWGVWLAAAQARPARRTQTDRPSAGVRCSATRGRSNTDSGATRRRRSEALPGASAPAQYSTAHAATKKTALSAGFANGAGGAVRSSYEDLRAQALTGGRGPGLAIFLHHGMREWIEVCSSCMTVLAPLEATPAEAATNSQPLLFLEKRWEATQ